MVVGKDAEWLGTPGRLALFASLAVSLVGVALFGSIVLAVGDWVEGRQVETVAAWAIPGLGLAVLAGVVALRVLLVRKGRRIALALGLSVAFSLFVLFLLDPAIAPPVP